LKRKYGNYRLKILKAPALTSEQSSKRATLKVVAFNMGVKGASGDIIALINQDIILERDWWAKLSKHYLDRNVVTVGCVILHAGDDLSWISNYEVKGGYSDSIAISGHAYTFRLKTAMDIDYFRETIWEGTDKNPIEDADLCIRLLERGKQYIDEEAVALHNHPVNNFGNLIKRSIDLGCARAIFAATYKQVGKKGVKRGLRQLSIIGLWIENYFQLSRIKRKYSRFYKPKKSIFVLSIYATIRNLLVTLSMGYTLLSKMFVLSA
jgi:GT2 family glycosyltransferase